MEIVRYLNQDEQLNIYHILMFLIKDWLYFVCDGLRFTILFFLLPSAHPVLYLRTNTIKNSSMCGPTDPLPLLKVILLANWPQTPIIPTIVNWKISTIINRLLKRSHHFVFILFHSIPLVWSICSNTVCKSYFVK